MVRFLNIFLIDYENVNSIGLHGIDLLNKNDKVYLFYSEKAESINIDIMNIIIKGDFLFKNFKLAKSDKNALDFQLVLFLGTMIKSQKKPTNFYIISNDNGYQSAIDFAKEQFNVDIKKFSSIYDAVNNIIEDKNDISLIEDIDNNNSIIEQQKEQINRFVEIIKRKISSNVDITNKISEGQINMISRTIINPEKNTQELMTEKIENIVGKKKIDLIPTILETCKEYFQFDLTIQKQPTLTKNQKRTLIEEKLKSSTSLKNQLIDNQFKQISAILIDDTKNTQKSATEHIRRCIGLKKEQLIPIILECCKDFIR